MAFQSEYCQPGMRVRVTQQMPQADKVWTNSIEGVVTRMRQAKTGSWYARAHDDKLWLDRLEIRKADGELVTLVLDQYSLVDCLDAPADSTDEPDGTEPIAA